MDPGIARRLVDLNARLYEERAAEFAASRRLLHPGIVRFLEEVPPEKILLVDLGCGDGRVGRAWLAGGPHRRYRGFDRSEALLARATAGSPPLGVARADFADPAWPQRVSLGEGEADVVVCFSVLHHLPGRTKRQRFLGQLAGLLRPDGIWALSVWQFFHIPELANRTLSKKEIQHRVGIDPEELERGDCLLDWRGGGRAWRYVHHYRPEELEEDCRAAGLDVLEGWTSDGRTGDLGLYRVGRATGRSARTS